MTSLYDSHLCQIVPLTYVWVGPKLVWMHSSTLLFGFFTLVLAIHTFAGGKVWLYLKFSPTYVRGTIWQRCESYSVVIKGESINNTLYILDQWNFVPVNFRTSEASDYWFLKIFGPMKVLTSYFRTNGASDLWVDFRTNGAKFSDHWCFGTMMVRTSEVIPLWFVLLLVRRLHTMTWAAVTPGWRPLASLGGGRCRHQSDNDQ
jgi:hypothetical protein